MRIKILLLRRPSDHHRFGRPEEQIPCTAHCVCYLRNAARPMVVFLSSLSPVRSPAHPQRFECAYTWCEASNTTSPKQQKGEEEHCRGVATWAAGGGRCMLSRAPGKQFAAQCTGDSHVNKSARISRPRVLSTSFLLFVLRSVFCRRHAACFFMSEACFAPRIES